MACCAFAQDTAPSSSPNSLTVLGDRLLFSADDGVHGRELWITDGEPGHARLLKDGWPGTTGSNPRNFFVLGDRVLFIAETTHDHFAQNKIGDLPWVSDGTPEGTATLVPSDLSSLRISKITWIAQRDGVAYFEGEYKQEIGSELLRTDVTSPGRARLVEDLWIGPDGSHPAHGGSAWLPDGRLVLLAYSAARENVYVFDPNNQQSAHLLEVRDDSRVLATLGPAVLFSTYDNAHGKELWRTDGTKEGTSIVKDIGPGPADANPDNLIVSGNVAYFSATDDLNGVELWVTDGTESGTRMLKDLNPGVTSSSPYKFTPAGPYVFFIAAGANTGREIWRTDGTADGTIMLKDINPGPEESEPYSLTALGNVVLFGARAAEYGEELWASDGTPEGTRLVMDIYPGAGPGRGGSPYGFAVMGRYAYFHATTQEHGVELWRSDGTEAGTMLIDDIWKEYLANPSSNPHELTNVDGQLYFAASDIEHGVELWRLDEIKGAVMVRDIFPGPASSNPHHLTAVASGSTSARTTVPTATSCGIATGPPRGPAS